MTGGCKLIIQNGLTVAATWGKKLQTILLSWTTRLGNQRGRHPCETAIRQIEDYPSGYPRFTALVATQGCLQICRRFSHLRARLLLSKQDKLSLLETQLENIDSREPNTLFLGAGRLDRNTERKSVLSEIDVALADYDALVERNHRILAFNAATARDVLSLQNWINGNACLARAETAYLLHGEDLLSVAQPDDGAITQLEAWVEDKLIRFFKRFSANLCQDASKDPHVYIFSGSLIKTSARIVMLFIIILLLLTPVVVCSVLRDRTLRVIIIIVSTIIFLGAMSGLTKPKASKMFLAGAT